MEECVCNGHPSTYFSHYIATWAEEPGGLQSLDTAQWLNNNNISDRSQAVCSQENAVHRWTTRTSPVGSGTALPPGAQGLHTRCSLSINQCPSETSSLGACLCPCIPVREHLQAAVAFVTGYAGNTSVSHWWIVGNKANTQLLTVRCRALALRCQCFWSPALPCSVAALESHAKRAAASKESLEPGSHKTELVRSDQGLESSVCPAWLEAPLFLLTGPEPSQCPCTNPGCQCGDSAACCFRGQHAQ